MGKTPRKYKGARTPQSLKEVRASARRGAVQTPKRSQARSLVAAALAVITGAKPGDAKEGGTRCRGRHGGRRASEAHGQVRRKEGRCSKGCEGRCGESGWRHRWSQGYEATRSEGCRHGRRSKGGKDRNEERYDEGGVAAGVGGAVTPRRSAGVRGAPNT
jgi:hypothetical protein